MKITLETNEQVTNWLHGLGLVKNDWETESENYYHDREPENPVEFTLGFEYGYEPPDENGNHEQWEFHDFTYICNEGKEWELDKTLIAPEWLKQQLIETVENYE